MSAALRPQLPLGVAILACLLLSGQADATTTYSKTEVVTYHDNTNIWVIGQTASLTCAVAVPVSLACDGDVVSATTFDAIYAVPVTKSAFGKLQTTLTYDTTSAVALGQRGTLNTISDAGGHTTTLTLWLRGIPQRMEHADATYKTAVVNPATGWITSTTDENAFTTSYAYDAMGRLTNVAYPSTDTVAWANTTRSFALIGTTEYGIPAGHWRQTTSTGNGVHVTYFDALWRPLLVREYDAGNLAGTEHFVKSTYNGQGQVEFLSYPSSSNTPITGHWSYYDALGRPISTSQDSELGPLTTTITYGSPFTTTVTDPRSQVTSTGFLTYEQPGTDWPLAIASPESVSTLIQRDPYGKPLTIKRSGPYAGSTLDATRTYVYDAYQRICQTIEPEVGTTIVAYTADDQIDWSADGQIASGTTDATCAIDRSTTPLGVRISRTYDPRHRELTRSTLSGTENRTATYYADGALNTLSAANPGSNPVTTTYTYNKRRLLTREVLQHNASTAWTFDYDYNTNGHLNSQTYPGSLVVGYAPDALGRPTQAGTFASNVTYYPSGAMSGFTYGNGILHTMTQNDRKLPANSSDVIRDINGNITSTVLNDSYTYDPNGNVLSLTDASNASATDNRTWGTNDPLHNQGIVTQYDGLDRLLKVYNANWGTTTGGYNAIYSYDPLDNLRGNRLGASLLSYGYDASNKLATLTYGTGSAQAVTTDVAGNITANAYRGQSYSFDLAHRMNAVMGVESYLYDGNGRRTRTLNSTTGSIEYFGYGADGRLLQDWSNRRNVRNGYIYLGNTLVGLYEVTLNTGAVASRYKHNDALGSPVVTTDAAKAVLSRTSYTPYGVPTLPVDGVGYTGHFIDVNTSLTYMQQRYYDPTLGRFLTIDPAQTDVETGVNFNRFYYGGNSPYSRLDPDGRRDIYIGGAGDKNNTRIVQKYAENQKSIHPDRDIQYVGLGEGKKLDAAMKAPLSKGEPLNIIGHSMGGSEAVYAASTRNVQVDNLITIDPVGAVLGGGPKPENVSTWLNITASPTDGNRSDFVAGLGRVLLGTTSTVGADISQSSTANHGDFSKMMGELGAERQIDLSYDEGQ